MHSEWLWRGWTLEMLQFTFVTEGTAIGKQTSVQSFSVFSASSASGEGRTKILRCLIQLFYELLKFSFSFDTLL